MKRTISKKIIIALLSAFVAVCMGFAVLLSRPAAQANAEETTETVTVTIVGLSGETLDSEAIPIGTSISSDVFTRYMKNVRDVYTTERYNFTGFYIMQDEAKTDIDPTIYSFSTDTAVYVKLSYCYFIRFLNVPNWTYSERVIQGSKMSAIPYIEHYLNGGKPTREGYVFKGWSYTENGEIITDFDVTVEDDINLYAVWENENVCTVSLIDGGAVIDFEEVEKGSVLSSDVISRFISKSSGKNPTDGTYSFDGFKKANGDNIDLSTYVFEDDTAIYFSWVRYFRITFKDDDTILYQSSEREGSTFTNLLSLSINTEKSPKDNVIYEFRCWSLTEDGKSEVTTDTVIMGDMTVYAIYNAIQAITLTFKKGDTVLLTKVVKKSVNIDFSQYPEILEAGQASADKDFAFAGWALTLNGTRVTYNGLVGSSDADLTFYAIYSYITYTVSFVGIDSVLGTKTVIINSLLSSIDLSDIQTYRKNYTFKGWSLSRTGSLIDLNDYKVTKDIVLYAKYEFNSSVSDPPEETPNDNLQSTFSEWKIILGTAGIFVAVMTVSSAFKKRR